MNGIFVTGTDTGIGKTLVSAALLTGLGARGLRCAGMKPVAAGLIEHHGRWRNDDVDMLMAAASVAAPEALVNPCALREALAPHLAAAHEGRSIDIANIRSAQTALARLCDWLVVEGVGGFRVPLTDHYDSADLAADFGLPVVLVVGMRLGCLSHALLTADAIRSRNLRLAGWVANCIDPAMAAREENIATLEVRLDAPRLGTIPHLGMVGHDAPGRAAPLLNLDLLLKGCSP